MGVYEYFSIYCIIKSWEDFMLDNLVDNRKLEKYNKTKKFKSKIKQNKM